MAISIFTAPVLMLAAWSGSTEDPPRSDRPPSSAVPIVAVAPMTPLPCRMGDAVAILYELHLFNYGTSPIELTAIDIMRGDGSGSALATMRGEELNGLLRPLGAPSATKEARVIGTGLGTVAFLEVLLGPADPAPAALHHRFTVTFAGREERIEGAQVQIQRGEPVVIGPPLRGDRWVAVNGPSNGSLHRRALVPVDGRARIAQRFAIDWMKLGPDGKAYHGDPTVNANWYSYGQEVLAVADGVVTAVHDGVPENTATSLKRAVPMTLETIGGNAVTIDHGDGHRAYYAHLQPGSPRVKVGERVRRGQVLGLLGNSGNSDAPHAHVHISDMGDPASLGAEGLPFSIDAYELLGRLSSTEEMFEGRAWATKAAPVRRERAMPLQNEIVRFPDGGHGGRE